LSLTRKKLFFIIALFCICINTADVIHWYIPQPIAIQQSSNKLRVLLVNIPTWPTEAKFSPIKPPLSWLLLIPIDHFLISPEIKVLDIRTGANVGSDHLPLIADLVLDK
jgi:hypothetical protein